MLKPQDVVVIAKLASASPDERTYPKLSAALGMSQSEVHAAVRRATESGLVDGDKRSVRRAALREFLIHGLRYVFPAKLGAITRGVPTSYAAAPLNERFQPGDLPPVWPASEGTVRGQGLAPLYKSVPAAALRDPELHQWLALIDAVRAGRARERNLAVRELERRLAA